MLLFAFGLIAGVALGLIVIGFLAIAAYDRGFKDAMDRRKVWRAELVARQEAVGAALQPARRTAS
ncbi:MAG: hypothetical protein M3O91_07095 [Chloroflexota bacterium]|nr:hypothetical protein [Chloroflexota bacterium]